MKMKQLTPVKHNEKFGYADEHGTMVIAPKFDSAFEFNDDVARVEINNNPPDSRLFNHGRFGYINKKGEWVVEPIFSLADDFADGVARVRLDASWGYLSPDGSFIVPPQFDYAEPFVGPIAQVRKGFFKGFIDRKGDWVVAPELQDITKFNEVDYYDVEGANLKHGLIDGCGKWVVEPKYDNIQEPSEGRFCVEKNYRRGFIDMDGNVIAEPQFCNAKNFREGLAAVTVPGADGKRESGQSGFIGLDGNWAIPPKFKSAGSFNNGVAIVSGDNWLDGLIDKNGEFILEPTFNEIHGFSEGLAIVELGKKFGFINLEGQIVVPVIYDGAKHFNNGLAKVCIQKGKKEVYGIVNAAGEEIIPVKYSWIGDVSDEGLIPVENTKGKYGFIDLNGKIVIKINLDANISFNNGKAKVSSNGKIGLMRTDGSFIGGRLFDDLEEFNDGLARAKDNGLWGFVNEDCEFVIPPQFDEVDKFESDLTRAQVVGRWGWIDRKGDWVIEAQFDETSKFIDGFAKVKIFIPRLRKCKWGLIDDKGNWVIQPEFDSATEVTFTETKNSDKDKLTPAQDDKTGLWGWQNKKGDWAIEPRYEKVREFVNDRASFMLKGKWGVTDENGNVILKPTLSEPVEFDEPRKWVGTARKKGLLDRDGKWIIPLEILEMKKSSNDGGINIAKLNDKWGLLDRVEGKWIIEPVYDMMDRYLDSIFIVKEGDKMGALDSKGRWIMPHIFDLVKDPYYNHYKDGLAEVKYAGKMGLWNVFTGEWGLKPEYDKVNNSIFDSYRKVEKAGLSGIVSLATGELLFGELYEEIDLNDDVALIKKGGMTGYRKINGEWISEPCFDMGKPFKDGLAQVTLKEKTGWLKPDGTLLGGQLFKYVDDFSEDVTKVSPDGENYGFLNRDGKWVAEPKYKGIKYTSSYANGDFYSCIETIDGDIGEFANGRGLLRGENGKYGYLDKDGKWIITPKFECAYNFTEKSPISPYKSISKLAKVSLDGKWGLIDLNGNYLAQPIYENIFEFHYMLAIVRLNGKLGFIDREGKLVIDAVYDSVEKFKDGISKVFLDGKEGYIDKAGRWYDKNPNR